MGEPEGKTGNASIIAEIDVLWITAGLGCDGDTIAMTAATQPSIEDIVLGGIPWIPKVNFHNPFLAMVESGKCRVPRRQLGAKHASLIDKASRWVESRKIGDAALRR